MLITIGLSLACGRSLSGSPFVLSIEQIRFGNTDRPEVVSSLSLAQGWTHTLTSHLLQPNQEFLF
jgi:hypothetical protein